jgi:PhnB protein
MTSFVTIVSYTLGTDQENSFLKSYTNQKLRSWFIMTIQLNPYIMLDGNAKEAIQFYEEAVDARVLFQQTFGEAPEDSGIEISEDIKDHVAHAVLNVGETTLFVADQLPGQSVNSGNQVTICITTNEAEKAKEFYELLQQDGEVSFPLQETYFSPAYAMVTDKFGVGFQIFTKKS